MRTTISLNDDVADLAAKMAEREKRNFSNLCEVALSEYCAMRNAPPKNAEIMAAVEEIGADRALDVLTRAARRKGVA